MEKVYIYALVDGSTDEVRYIGKTIKTIEHRFKEHLRCARNGVGRPVYKWLKKASDENRDVSVRLLETTTVDAWIDREIFWIAYYRAILGTRVLNVSAGGESNLNYVPSLETRKKISEANKGKGKHNYWKGKKFSEEHKNAIKEGCTGQTRTAETKSNISKGLTGKILTDEHKKNISDSRKGTEAHNKRRIVKIDLKTGVELKEYDSVLLATLDTTATKGNIVTVCKGRAKSAGGYFWKYIN